MVSKSRRRQSGDDRSNRSSSEVKASPHFFKIIHSSGVPHQKLATDIFWYLGTYDGNCNFNVLIFDTSASEIEYPVSATHGEQTNINGNGKSKIHVTEDAIEIDDSVVTLGDTPCATYNTKREEICGRGEIEKLSVQTRQKTRQASYYRANIEKDASVKILDDSLVRDSPVSERKRANTKSGMENNSNMHEFSPDIQSKGLKLPNQKIDVKTEIETEEGAGGTPTGLRRHQSQIPVKMLSTTANMNSRALERARDFKSKKPFFTVHMQPSYVSGPSTRRSGGKVAEASGSGEQIEHPSFTVVITKLYRSRLCTIEHI
ncbi:hypothetical protein RHGRI_023481 [Rhododendron griersonianum]|uniref:Uncharacterized protein n=1 Tax=Rhododendron griersonianum TaxID=479676 RepID=A0AAV6J5S1_9ERIC|nr:hypothetical protein RHGRI_023481 [Rhododendron griersonianum]